MQPAQQQAAEAARGFMPPDEGLALYDAAVDACRRVPGAPLFEIVDVIAGFSDDVNDDVNADAADDVSADATDDDADVDATLGDPQGTEADACRTLRGATLQSPV